MTTSEIGAPSEIGDVAEVRECERRRAQALIAADPAALGALLADEFVYTHASGKADGRAAYLDLIRSGSAQYRSVQTSETHTHSYTSATVMTGRIEVVVDHAGQNKHLTNRFTAVWVRRPPSWQLVAWQLTALPAVSS